MTGMAAYAETVHSGWQARLDLSFDHRNAGTVLARNRHTGPLQVQKSLYPEGRDTCHAVILHPPGGIVAGDDLGVRVSLGARSRALLTTPGAAKWYRSEGPCATQHHAFAVEGDAVLEWLPRENILFDGAHCAMCLDVVLSTQGKYFGWDILSFGRRASGERWRHGKLSMRSSIVRADRVLWSERAHIDAAGGFAQSAAGLSGFSVCGTFAVAGYEVGDALLAACRLLTPAGREARTGLTRLPGVLIARYLGDSTEAAFDWFTSVWRLLRPALTDRVACAPRVWAC
jgi:urease accessory protein